MAGTEAIRVIADVHGEPDMLLAAAGDAERIVLLGDLVDRGPDSAAVLRIVLDWIENGRARLVRSNHDDKLNRALLGKKIVPGRQLAETLLALAGASDGASLKERFVRAYAAAPAVLQSGDYLLAHGAIDPKRFDRDGVYRERPAGDGTEHMALYGEVDGSTHASGRPVRYYRWVDKLPAPYTAIVGHDRRADQTTPTLYAGARGGRALFLDTGCGKGGALSFVDLPGETIGQIAPA